MQWPRPLGFSTLSRAHEEVIYFPVNHLELSGLLMMCGWALGALWKSPGHVFQMALCCLPQVSCVPTWTGS